MIGRTPYRALFGCDPRVGLDNSGLPPSILANIHAEEDLEEIISDEAGGSALAQGTSANVHVSAAGDRAVDESSDDEDADVLADASDGQGLSDDDAVGRTDGESGAGGSTSDRRDVQTDRRDVQTDSGCVDEADILRERVGAYEGMVKQAKKMGDTVHSLPELGVGSSVVMAVPKVDRGPLDPSNIHAVITDRKNDVYQLGTRAGIIKGWFPRSALRATKTNEVGVADAGRALGLREAFREQSMFVGQGMQHCTTVHQNMDCSRNACLSVRVMCKM